MPDLDLNQVINNYDIRGTYPDQLNSEIAYNIGRAFADLLDHGTIAVGRDMRVSSEDLYTSLVKGLTKQGSNVVDLGLISTDMVYFTCGKYGYDGGVMITASHNPPQFGGLKFCRENAIPISRETGISRMQEIIENDEFAPTSKQGTIEPRDIIEDWIKHTLGFIDPNSLKPLKVAVDAGNGMAGKIMPYLAKHLSIDIVPLFFELDGNFPNHLANPIDPDNIRDLQHKVLETKADIGLAFDGDADRVFLVDEKANGISGTITTAMVAQMLARKHPGSNILYNAICGDIVPEVIRQNGCTPIRTKVGHSLIKKDMRTHNGLFAGEHSGHYYFRDNYYADSGLIAALIVLELISIDGRPVSEIVRQFDKYHASGEINTRVSDISAKLEQLKDKYRDGVLDELDGITVRFDDWWFNVRASNTEPLLRLNVEAEDQKTLDEKTKELVELIRE